MAGMPHRRILQFTMPQAARLPADFELMPDSEKFRTISGWTLDQAALICLWDVNRLPSFQLSIWNQVRHDLWNLMFKMGLEDRRGMERERALNALIKDLPERFRPK
jgi:hypothetical protein